MQPDIQAGILEILREIPTYKPQNFITSLDRLAEGAIDFSINTQDYEKNEGVQVTFTDESFFPYYQTQTPNPRGDLQLIDYIDVSRQTPIHQQCSDLIVELSLNKYQSMVQANANKELQDLQNCVCSVLENNQISFNNFSANTLINTNKYETHTGELLEIGFMNVPYQNKHYTDEDDLMKMPHPIRMKKRTKKRKTQQGAILRKTAKEITDEFDILGGMFSLDENSRDQQNEKNAYKQILKLLDFQDSQYNDLWQDILKDIELNRDIQSTDKKNIIKPSSLSDKEFLEAVERIIKEAEQYEEELEEEYKDENEVDTEESSQKEQVVEEKKQEPKNVVGPAFETIRIEAKIRSQEMKSRYPYAQEDESDLTHFYDQLPKEKFAMPYPFELDQFQKRSILHLEKKESVFVAAHTSAGKTVIAEYGIALAIKHKRKVIYTSPIKALSNQKYRDFVQKFDSVGIVTGDVSLNQQANCVIMTTEILRDCLYKGADMVRDIQWVIFDEVHYINNADRGVVWEETIILLPEHIGIIMLSATVPNYMDFANWVGRTKRRKIFVMKTFHRPVPLEHSLFIFDKFHVVKEANGSFLKEEYVDLRRKIQMLSMDQETLKAALKQDKKKKLAERGWFNDSKKEQNLKFKMKNINDKFIKNVSQGDLHKSKDREEARMITELINQCRDKQFLPCVIFCFSKRKIQSIAENIYTNKLNNSQESHKVIQFFAQALVNLKPEDKELNQFQFLAEICKNGYAIHHGDLLPLAKEIVELLFSQGLIKVLIATETFAMGINMPTKTVIFHTIKKFDGVQMDRFLNSSEYVQMSGRAGRRGLDEKGNVIIMVKDPKSLPQPYDMIKMIDYPGEELRSKFKITYQIILNLFNSKDLNTEDMMRQSFVEDEKFSNLPRRHLMIKDLKREYDRLSEFVCPYNQLGTRLLIEEYMNSAIINREINQKIFYSIDWAKTPLPKFAQILGHNNETQTVILLKVDQDSTSGRSVQILLVNQIDLQFFINREELDSAYSKKKKRIILQYENSKTEKNETAAVQGTNNKFHYYVQSIKPSELLNIYSNKIQMAKHSGYSRQVYQELAQLLIDPPKKLTSMTTAFNEKFDKDMAWTTMSTLACHKCQVKEAHTNQNIKRHQVKQKLTDLMGRVDKNDLMMMSNFNGMFRMLKQYSFVSDNSMLLKGKIARQLDIYLTEVLVEAVLDPLDHQEIAALLSGFVCQYRVKDKKNPNKIQPFHPQDTYHPKLTEAIQKTVDIVEKMAEAEIECGAYLGAQKIDLINNVINFHLAKPIYHWAQGVDFIDICDNNDNIPEGIIVRTILRLDILLRNLKTGCIIMGNMGLAAKVELASECIKRDIVFTQSLYLC